MSDRFDLRAACPPATTIHRAGAGLAAAPEGVASGPFRVQMLLSSRVDGEMTAMRALVPPGIVTHWHSHPRGQLLFVLDGVGLVRSGDGDVVELRAGDSVWFPPGERHWHGAAPSSPLEYLSVQPVKDGRAVDWMEPVDLGAQP